MTDSTIPRKKAWRIDRLEIEARSSSCNPREIEQVVDQLRLSGSISMDGFDRLRHDASVDRSHAQHRCPSENRIQRRAKLVGDGRHEFVFQLVGRFGFRARPLGLLVQTSAIESLSAVLRDRNQQRLILVVEVHGRAEVELEHANRRALDEKRQRRRRTRSPVGRERRRAPVLLLQFGERTGKDRLSGLERVGRAQAWLESGSVAGEQLEIAFAGA